MIFGEMFFSVVNLLLNKNVVIIQDGLLLNSFHYSFARVNLYNVPV